MSKILKRKIDQLENKHRVIADNLLDAIWILDVESQKIEYITPSIERISGYTADEYATFALKDRMTPESYEKVLLIMAEEMERFEKGVKVTRTLEAEFIHKNGETYWSEIKARFVKEADSLLKVIGVTREITERKNAEQKQDELIQKLGEAITEKEKLLKEVSVLRGLLPICSCCKRLRDEDNRWWPLEAYVERHTDAEITHTVCPDCKEVIYGD